MLRTAKAKIISLVLVGTVALGGAVYAGTALAAGGASASTVTAQAPQTPTGAQLRSSILDMLRDRMGLTGPNAEQFADQMIARMQSTNAGFDFQAMVDRCALANGTGPANGGWGMMNGSGPVDGGTTPSAGAPGPGGTDPTGPGPQNGGSGFASGGMMGASSRGMMGASGLR